MLSRQSGVRAQPAGPATPVVVGPVAFNKILNKMV